MLYPALAILDPLSDYFVIVLMFGNRTMVKGPRHGDMEDKRVPRSSAFDQVGVERYTYPTWGDA